MERKPAFSFIGVLVIVLALILSGCGGGNVTVDGETTGDQTADSSMGNGASGAEGSEPSEAGQTAAEQVPDTLVIHPDAVDIEANPAAGTFVYIVPMMAQETSDYLLAEMKALGWSELGNPTVMGHLATINMQMDNNRVTISMQDNELSQTTRVQILLLEQ